MTDIARIKRIGYLQAFKAITIGWIMVYFILALIDEPLWFLRFDLLPFVISVVIVSYGVGYYFGGLIGIWILKKNKAAIVFGILGGFLIVWSTTLIASLILFFTEGLKKGNLINFHHHIYEPIGVITIFGFLPIIAVGIWFGLSIKKLAKTQT